MSYMQICKNPKSNNYYTVKCMEKICKTFEKILINVGKFIEYFKILEKFLKSDLLVI